MRRDEQGSTLVFTLAAISLLAATAAALVSVSSSSAAWATRHQRRVQTQYLCAAGLEQVRHWAASGVMSNATYALGEGTVEVTMHRAGLERCRVTSRGRLPARGEIGPIEIQQVMEIPWR